MHHLELHMSNMWLHHSVAAPNAMRMTGMKKETTECFGHKKGSDDLCLDKVKKMMLELEFWWILVVRQIEKHQVGLLQALGTACAEAGEFDIAKWASKKKKRKRNSECMETVKEEMDKRGIWELKRD